MTAQLDTPAAPAAAPLRAWQRAALVTYLRSNPRDFLAVATPGAGKTTFALRIAADGRWLLVFSAIDNLVKGAAGQAIQNWNRMQDWPEETGLPLMGWACA